MKRPAPVFTNLGMHFVNVSADRVVLVQVEVNVRGLLAVHGRRLVKSKSGRACLSSGAVRMSLATPDDREIAHAVAHSPTFINERAAHEALSENERLHTEITPLRHEVLECGHTVECAINSCNAARDELAALKSAIANPQSAI